MCFPTKKSHHRSRRLKIIDRLSISLSAIPSGGHGAPGGAAGGGDSGKEFEVDLTVSEDLNPWITVTNRYSGA
ncbi:hypothetical protein PENTCL1PPCAC_13394 [Pristionchus entomophagus]|uniref:Uncharacterized protein n=1 Tax=Pristionchus entomophagus TaxID=358040 RepID=A0AAV5T7D2_9BILA|nr:hypothetical protein PENTCL1PPCAC_13394 [Pristionchus entomophagus]